MRSVEVFCSHRDYSTQHTAHSKPIGTRVRVYLKLLSRVSARLVKDVGKLFSFKRVGRGPGRVRRTHTHKYT